MLTLYNTQIVGQERLGKGNKLPLLRTVMLQDLKELSGFASMISVLIWRSIGCKENLSKFKCMASLKTQINLNYIQD